MPRLAIVVVLLVAIAGCTQQDDPTVAVPGSPPGPPVAATATSAEVPEALAFSATTVQGAAFDGADHAGQDLMVWFWAPW